MARGTWKEGENKVRAGFYNRLVSEAEQRIQNGQQGIVAIPVRANWGPKKKVIEIRRESELIKYFHTDVSPEFTAYETIKLALLGKPEKVLVYSMDDGSSAPAVAMLKSDAESDLLQLQTIYPTSREFNVTKRPSLLDADKDELILYEGAKKLVTFTFDKGSIDAAVEEIEKHPDNHYIKAIKKSEGTIADVANIPLDNGNAGVSSITIEQYVAAMELLEAYRFNHFCLDGKAEADLQTSVKIWVNRLRSQGKKVVAFLGGSEADDKLPSRGNTRSKQFNSEGVINVTVSAQYQSVWYSSAKVAAYIAGLAAGIPIEQSLTFVETIFEDVYPRLTDDQFAEAINSGSFTLSYDGSNGGRVICERGINTLTSLSDNQGPIWKKIKGIRVMDTFDTETADAGHTDMIGRLINNPDGQAYVISVLQNYFGVYAPNVIASDFEVGIDTERMENADGDQFFWYYRAKIEDSMEEIYGTGYIRER